MTGKEFIDDLYRRYYPDLEGPVLALRKTLAELDPQSDAFVSLMQRQAKRELRHGIAFSKALLQYDEMDHHERAQVAEQAADEYRHYAFIKDYLLSRGADVEHVPAAAFDAYFDQFLTGDVEAFRLCNIAEKSAIVFLTHMSQHSRDPVVRKLATGIVGDEVGHEDQIKTKLAKIADDETRRAFIEKQFVQSWSTQKEGVILEATELGIDIDNVLSAFKHSLEENHG